MSILHNTTKHERKVSIQIKTCQKKEERKKEKYKRANSLELHHELKGWRHSVGSRIPRTHSGPRASLTLQVTQPGEENNSMVVVHDPDENRSSNLLMVRKQSSKQLL